MTGFPVPKLLALLALAAGLVAGVLDWRDARADRAALKICTAAAKAPAAPLDGCPEVVRFAIEDARRTAACDEALAAGEAFGIRTTCSEPVKRQFAQLGAAVADLADMKAQLADAQARTTAAIQRAEARATTQARRTSDAKAALARAPRAADGLIRCDAECLRHLSGEAPDGR